MKRGLLVLSLLANVALVTAFALRPELAPANVRDLVGLRARSGTSPVPAKTTGPRVRAPAPPPRWSTLGSNDYATLVARLRAAGFPPALIRQIVVNEISRTSTAQNLALSEPGADVPFWKIRPNQVVPGDKRFEEASRLRRETDKLIRDLFQDEFFEDEGLTKMRRQLYGNLPRNKLEAIQAIEEDYREMTRMVSAAWDGIELPEDREKLALLRKEQRADLAALLTPAELAEYEIRTSGVTALLRDGMSSIQADEAEFRAVHAAYQTLSDRFPDVASVQRMTDRDRTDAISALQQQLRAGLGEARYAEYVRETDDEYRYLKQTAQREKVSAESVVKAYDLRESLARESNRIFDDPTLTTDQKRAALRSLARNTRDQFNTLLGPVVGPAYTRKADSWLGAVEAGGAVTLPGPPLMMARDRWTFSIGINPTVRSLPGS